MPCWRISSRFNDIFYWKFLLQPIFSTYCIAIEIFCQYAVSHTFAAYNTFQFPFRAHYRMIGPLDMAMRYSYAFNYSPCAMRAKYHQFGNDFDSNSWITKLNWKFHIQCEDMEIEIYNLDWHLLTTSYQRAFIIMIRRWQGGTELNIGPFGVLDYKRGNFQLNWMRIIYLSIGFQTYV